MVSRELDFSRISQITADNLQNLLERNNQPYLEARNLYNQLINNAVNPLNDSGLVTEKDSFIIILLENFLRNTEYLIDQNINLQSDLTATGKEVFNISIKGLEPIITAGNKISIELEKFEQGFKNWNQKFDNFSTLFDTWNLGFKTLESKLAQLEHQITNSSGHHTNIINNLEKVLNQINSHINQWKLELIRINDFSQQTEENNKNTISTIEKIRQSLETNFLKTRNSIEQIKNSPSQPSTSATYPKQIFQTLPSNNHNFEFKNVNSS